MTKHKKFDKILIQILFFKRLNGDFLEHYFTNNTDLKSEIRTIVYEYQSIRFEFLSDHGVFSKNKIDYGSRLLVETLLKYETRKNLNILDVGCGYGFIGIVVGKILDSTVLMCDINKRALHLTNRNIEKNKIRGSSIISNGYENITKKYDLIITNPPIRAGKKVVLNIVIEARNHLNQNGKLWFVMRKDQGAKSIIKEVEKYGFCKIIEKSKGFYIIMVEFG